MHKLAKIRIAAGELDWCGPFNWLKSSEFKSAFKPTLADVFLEYQRLRTSSHETVFHIARELAKIILPFLFPIVCHEKHLVSVAKKIVVRVAQYNNMKKNGNRDDIQTKLVKVADLLNGLYTEQGI